MLHLAAPGLLLINFRPYYDYGGRGVYDIRHPYDDPTPPTYFIDYLNTAKVQDALGVNIVRSTGLYRFRNTG